MFLWFSFLLLATASRATGGKVRSRLAAKSPAQVDGPCFNKPDLNVSRTGEPSLFLEADEKLKCLDDDSKKKCSEEACNEIQRQLGVLEELMKTYRQKKKEWETKFDTFKDKTEAFRSDQTKRKELEKEGLKDIMDVMGMFKVAFNKHNAALTAIGEGGERAIAMGDIVPGGDGPPLHGEEDEQRGLDRRDGDEDEDDGDGDEEADEQQAVGEMGAKKSCKDPPFDCQELTRNDAKKKSGGLRELCVNRKRCSEDEEEECKKPECKCNQKKCEAACGGKCQLRGYTKTQSDQQEQFWVCTEGGLDEDEDKKDSAICDGDEEEDDEDGDVPGDDEDEEGDS